jgi:thiol-disulfide isomerase/thioredoxin
MKLNRKTLSLTRFTGLAAVLVLAAVGCLGQPMAAAKATGQTGGMISVKQIDIEGLRKLIKPSGRPLLVNFWATWCDPCREEFPDLVQIDKANRDKIDFITVSLDDLADIATYVPKFLTEMKAEMPAFLLHTPDESAAITMVSPTWTGNLPMTILYSADGKQAYTRNGKVRVEALQAEINKLLSPEPPK